MDLALVIKAQVAAHGLAKLNQSRAARSREGKRGLNANGGRSDPAHLGFKGGTHPLGPEAAMEAKRIAGLDAPGRRLSALLCDNPPVRGIRRLLAFYDIPAVKFVMRSTVQLALLSLHFLCLAYTYTPAELQSSATSVSNDVEGDVSSAGGPSVRARRGGRRLSLLDNIGLEFEWYASEPNALFEPQWSEIALFAFFLTVFLDRCHRSVKLWQQQSIGGGGSGGGDAVWGVIALLYAVSFVLRTLCYVLPMQDEGSTVLHLQLYQAYQICLAVNSICVFLGSLPLLSLSPSFGVLTIVLRLMVRDAILWGALFSVLVAGFAGTYLGFERAGLYRQAPYPVVTEGSEWGADEELEYDAHIRTHPLVAALWAGFGLSEQERFVVWTDPLGITYALVMGLGMSNLLVAMFADSYVNVQSNAKVLLLCLRSLSLDTNPLRRTHSPAVLKLPS